MRVGTSLHVTSRYPCFQDHPHACGDKENFAAYRKISSGSSPCVWGQDEWVFSERDRRRIIPMRVGTRSGVLVSGKLTKDHPHACGDKKTLRIDRVRF